MSLTCGYEGFLDLKPGAGLLAFVPAGNFCVYRCKSPHGASLLSVMCQLWKEYERTLIIENYVGF